MPSVCAGRDDRVATAVIYETYFDTSICTVRGSSWSALTSLRAKPGPHDVSHVFEVETRLQCCSPTMPVPYGELSCATARPIHDVSCNCPRVSLLLVEIIQRLPRARVHGPTATGRSSLSLQRRSIRTSHLEFLLSFEPLPQVFKISLQIP